MDVRVNISLQQLKSLSIRSRRADEILGQCPVCGGKDANFNIVKKVWRCWHCPAHGFILGENGEIQIEEIEPEPVKVLDITQIRKLYTSLAEKYHQNLPTSARDYLLSRGLSLDTIDKFKLGFCSTDFYEEYSDPLCEDAGVMNRKIPTLVNRIVIPYQVNGEVVDLRGRILNGMEYRPNTPTYISLVGNRKSRGANHLFNEDVIAQSDEVILTEGEFKSIVGDQYGFSIVATPGIFGWEREWTKLLKAKRKILVADYDKVSGTRSPNYLMAKLLSRDLPDLKVASLKWLCSKEKVDIDSLLIEGNKDTFERSLKGAVDVQTWLNIEERNGRGHRKKENS